MRVLHVNSGNLYGGVETLMRTLAVHQGLCPELEQDFALCFEGRLSEELRAAGAAVHLLGGARVSRPVSMWRVRRALEEVLGRERFDVVVCHAAWSQTIFGTVARAARLPLVFWLHEVTEGKHWLERWARLTPPDLALCNSRYTANALPNMYPQTRGEVLYCPVAAPGAIHDSHGERAAVRAEFDTPRDVAVIIQTSRMEDWKGHALHLEALGLLRDVPGWFCWQVGGAQRPHEEQYFDELKRAAARLGIADRVRFAGQRTDVARLLAAADIHCQPNTRPEPFGIAFVEAMHARLPVVTCAHGGALEIVDDSCGILTAPGDARALAASLRSLIEDATLRARLGACGAARARELCDPATQIWRLAALLSSVARHAEVAA